MNGSRPMSASSPMLRRVPGIGIELSSSRASRLSRSIGSLLKSAPDRLQLPDGAAAHQQHRAHQQEDEALDLVRHAALGEEDVKAQRAGCERRQDEHDRDNYRNGFHGAMLSPWYHSRSPRRTPQEIPWQSRSATACPTAS